MYVAPSRRCLRAQWLALGDGNSGEKDSITAMSGAEGGSGKAVPFAVVPERGQRSENLSEALSVEHPKEVCDVLHEHVSGSKVANDSGHLSPKRSLGMIEAGARASTRHALAREAAGDEVDSLGMSVNCSDVWVDGDAWESLPEQSLPELVDLAEPAMLKAGEVESVGEQSASIEEATDSHQRK